jgi:hypothetical protein
MVHKATLRLENDIYVRCTGHAIVQSVSLLEPVGEGSYICNRRDADCLMQI